MATDDISSTDEYSRGYVDGCIAARAADMGVDTTFFDSTRVDYNAGFTDGANDYTERTMPDTWPSRKVLDMFQHVVGREDVWGK